MKALLGPNKSARDKINYSFLGYGLSSDLN